MEHQLDINIQTKIGKLLEVYPQLEEVLLSLSPSFAKLKNPILRKTVARVATIRQVAEVGGLDVGQMISILRKAVGMDLYSIDANQIGKGRDSKPEWANEESVSIIFDALQIIEEGGSPMKDILEKAKEIETGGVMLLVAPFRPAPIIELLNSKGYETWCESVLEEEVYTYIQYKKD